MRHLATLAIGLALAAVVAAARAQSPGLDYKPHALAGPGATQSGRKLVPRSPFGALMSATPTIGGIGFNWANQPSGAMATNVATGVQVTAPAQSSTHDLAALYISVPPPPYTITALIATMGPTTSFYSSFIGWANGATSAAAFQIYHVQQYVNNVEILHGSALTGTGAAVDTTGNEDAGMFLMWYRLKDDGTTVYFQFSRDGYTFVTFYSVAKSAGYLGSSGYSNIIVGADCYSQACAATILSWARG